MTFPHRTAFYDEKDEIIINPNSAKRHDESLSLEGDREWLEIVVNSIGKAFTLPQSSKPNPAPDTFRTDFDRYTPLASTGLHGSEDNEVFEGHLVRWGNNIYVVCYANGMNKHKGLQVGFYLTDSNFERWYELKSGTIEIAGHVLTDPELVPESFAVDEYFNRNGTDS